MKISKLSKKRKVVLSHYQKEHRAFEYVISRINNNEMCDFFYNHYKRYFPTSTITREGCRLKWDGVFLTLSNEIIERVLFIYGPNGQQSPVFCYWDKNKKHTKYPVFRFWDSLWILNEEEEAANGFEFTFTRDILLSIYKHLGVRDLLSCRIVDKQWCRVATMNCIWEPKILCKTTPMDEHSAFNNFLKSACLVADEVSFLLDNPKVFEIVGRAWLYKYRGINFNDIQPNLTILHEKDVFATNMKPLLGLADSAPRKYVLMAMRYTDTENGSIAWITRNRKLAIANFTNANGFTTKPILREMMLDYLDDTV